MERPFRCGACERRERRGRRGRRGATHFAIASLLAALSFCVGSAPRVAHADDEAAAAESLFQEARKLADAGNFKEACPKFLASQKAGPGVGTLLNLGACYEKLGQVASAWARYKEAQSFAQHANRPDRERTAKDRALKLEPRLPKLTLSWKDPSIEVKRDDVPVDEGAIGSPVPVDPGAHTITARASGKKTWSKTVTIAEAQSENVTIPPLEEDTGGGDASGTKTERGGDPQSATAAPPTESKGNGMRTASYVVLGAGVLGVGIGSYFGLATFSTWSDAKKHCAGVLCDATGVKLASDAKTDGTISTTGIFVGGALLGLGVALFFMAPSDKASAPPTGTLTSPKITPSVGPTFAGLTMSGAL